MAWTGRNLRPTDQAGPAGLVCPPASTRAQQD